MQAILQVTLPFFALVLCGYAAAWRQWLPLAAIPGLNAFVLFFALPCLLFRFGARTPLAELLNPAALGVYVAAGVIVVLLTVWWSLHRRIGMKDAAFGALVAAFPNTGFMGVPMLAALLGDDAVGPVICTLIADLFITSSLCIALARTHLPGRPATATATGTGTAAAAAAAAAAAGAGPLAAVQRAMRGTLSNPLPWAIAAGALFAQTRLALPGPLDSMVQMLAAAATPVALFSIGAVLWRARAAAAADLQAQPLAPRQSALVATLPPPPPRPGRPADVLTVALTKLLLHPLLVWLLGAAAVALGAALSPLQWTALTLAAALPSASNVSLLADRYGADNNRIARIILVSTVLAFGSFSLLAWLLGVGR